MRNYNISRALGAIDEKYILEAAALGAPGSKEMRHGKPKRVNKKQILRTVLIAAAIAAFFSVTAYAVNSIHAARQQQIRSGMNIDGAKVSSYVEYNVPEENEKSPAAENLRGNLTLLSAINDGEHQQVYVDVSPVKREQVFAMDFMYTLSGMDGSGVAEPVVTDTQSFEGLTGDELKRAVLESAYDEDTETLTLVCRIRNDALPESGTAELSVTVWAESGNSGQIGYFGPVEISRVEQELRVFSFDNAVFTDEETGVEVTIRSLELSPTGARLNISYDGCDDTDGKNENPALLNMEDKVFRGIRLVLDDKSERDIGGGVVSQKFGDGFTSLYCSWQEAIDINAVGSVYYNGTELEIK